MLANNTECKNVVSPQEMTIEGLKCILECTVCLTTPTSPPVHRCNNGHIICHVCRPQLTKEKCPVCRIQLGNLRCLTTEKTTPSKTAQKSTKAGNTPAAA